MSSTINPTSSQPSKDDGRDEAADLVRSRLDDLYDGMPEQAPEHESLIDRFWKHHRHEHPDQDTAWRKFYEALGPQERQRLWQEYGSRQQDTPAHAGAAGQAPAKVLKHEKRIEPLGDPREPAKAVDTSDKAAFPLAQPQPAPKAEPVPEPQRQAAHPAPNAQEKPAKGGPETIAMSRQRLLKKLERRSQENKGWKGRTKPLIAALVAGLMLFVVFNNTIIVAAVRQYVSPGAGVASPIIVDPNAGIKIGKEPRIIIPKINVDVPVVYDVTTYEESAIQAGLERGVVHYGSTPLPGQPGNNVIVGHSSNNFFNQGKYKFAFVLLDKLETGDTFILHYEGTRYVYKVYKKVVVEPNDFSIIQPTAVPTTTLITCTPPGTAWKRLVVQAEQISPAPTQAQPADVKLPSAEQNIVPGAAPSLWERVTGWAF